MPLSDIARAVEDRFHRDTVPVLKRQGWRPRVIPYDGYGTSAPAQPGPTAPQHQEQHQNTATQRSAAGAHRRPASASRGTSSGSSQPTQPSRPAPMARVLARMVMRPQDAPAEGPLFRSLPDTLPVSAAQARSFAMTGLSDAQRGWRLFIEVPVAFLPVTVHVGRASVRTRADRSGYIDVVVRDHGLEPGWHEARIEAMGAHAVAAKVLIIPEGPRLGIISDIDDTAMVTHVPRVLVAAWGLDVDISASWGWVVLTALIDAFVGVSLGLLVSAFARTEFQAVQFMPVVIAPQLFLCGLLVSRDQLPRALEVVGDALPMSWAVDAVTELTLASEPSDDFFRYLAYLVGFGLVVLGVAASTVPRKTR